MSRDDFDIPEVFRRAMEEMGWDSERRRREGQEGGEGGDGGQRPPPRQASPRRPSNRFIWLSALALGVLFSLNFIITTITDYLWFQALSYDSVWLRQWGFRISSFIIFFLIALGMLLLNWHLARRRAIRDTSAYHPKIVQLPGVRWLINIAAFFLAFGFAGTIAPRWSNFMQYFYRVPYGEADPIFNLDFSFYVFELPVYEAIQQWLLTLLVLTLIGVVGLYAANHIVEIQQGQWRPQFSNVLRRHLILLLFVLLLLWATGDLFNILNLVYSDRGVVFGVTYTDLNATLYGLVAQAVALLFIAVALLFNWRNFQLRPLLATGGIWVAALLLTGLVGTILQQTVVASNEPVREAEFIDNNITLTRKAYGLDQIESRPYPVGDSLTMADIAASEVVLKNVRLWDYRPLGETYQQIQGLRDYYQFGEIDIDRYIIDGELRQVMLAARELNTERLEGATWVNERLEFTHGYGIVMNPVDVFTDDGQPIFFIQDLPPISKVDISVERPEVYYGEITNNYVLVATDRDEFSYPSTNEEAVYSSYEGQGGVILDNGLKRFLYALHFGDPFILLNNDINRNTRIMYRRMIQDRIQEITPFLALDQDPYLVLLDGRLVWVQDAYTVTDRFPYATPTGFAINGTVRRVNYVRNSVKITVDAYDGDVQYYAIDPQEPILRTFSRAFPGLFKSMTELPAGLQDHFRYPVDLFYAQTELFLRYHVTDVRVFYNQLDLWARPREIFNPQGNSLTGDNSQEMEPYYVTMPLPGESEPEFLLILPYTPANKQNMIAWIAARNDPENYGESLVYQIPDQQTVLGPMLIEAQIDQEPAISEQFSLWNQNGSTIIRGNLLVIPIGDSFLYVEPIYLKAATGAFPELKRVIVATDSNLAMAETLQEALVLALGEEGNIVFNPSAGEASSSGEGGNATGQPFDASPEALALIASANANFEAAEQAQREGDWTAYGEALAALEADLAELMQLTE